MTTQTPEPTSPFSPPQPSPGYGPPFGEQPWPLNSAEEPTSYMPGATPPAGKPPRSRRSVPLLIAVLGGAGLTLASCLGGVAVGSAGTSAKPAPAASTVTKTVQLPAPAASTVTVTKTIEVTPPAAAAPPPPPAAATIGEGSWTAGEDFPPGTYKTTGSGDTCYWAIYKPGANIGSFDGIIDNHNGGGNLRVTLQKGQGFESERCGTWSKVG